MVKEENLLKLEDVKEIITDMEPDEFASENLAEALEVLENTYTGASACDDMEGMERALNALYIMQRGFPRFLEVLREDL